jgi:hypothetical protein
MVNKLINHSEIEVMTWHYARAIIHDRKNAMLPKEPGPMKTYLLPDFDMNFVIDLKKLAGPQVYVGRPAQDTNGFVDLVLVFDEALISQNFSDFLKAETDNLIEILPVTMYPGN